MTDIYVYFFMSTEATFTRKPFTIFNYFTISWGFSLTFALNIDFAIFLAVQD